MFRDARLLSWRWGKWQLAAAYHNMIGFTGREVLAHLQPALTTTDIGVSKMAEHKIDGNDGAGNVDLIRRIDAMQACQVGPSDEWSNATKDGYNQAATDCAMAIMRIAPISNTAPAVLPLLPDMVDAATAAGVVVWWDNEAQEIKMAVTVQEAARVLMELPEVPTDAQLHYACLSYRHDYGLMDLVSREKLQWECREWWRCISRAAIAPPEA